MRIFADENVPRIVVDELRRSSHDVAWGAEYGQGMSDAARMADAYQADRVVLTEDNDFADLIMVGRHAAHDLIRFDLPSLGRSAKAQRILDAMRMIGDQARGRLTVIEASRVRQRPLP